MINFKYDVMSVTDSGYGMEHEFNDVSLAEIIQKRDELIRICKSCNGLAVLNGYFGDLISPCEVFEYQCSDLGESMGLKEDSISTVNRLIDEVNAFELKWTGTDYLFHEDHPIYVFRRDANQSHWMYEASNALDGAHWFHEAAIEALNEMERERLSGDS